MSAARLRRVGSRLVVWTVLLLVVRLSPTDAAPLEKSSSAEFARGGPSAMPFDPDTPSLPDVPAPAHPHAHCTGDAAAQRAELEALLEDLNDPDYQVRWKACRTMGRKGRCWLIGDGTGGGQEDPCAEGEGTYTLFLETFTRTGGAPNAFSRTFAVTEPGSVCIKATNNGLSSAEVKLEDITAFGPSSFNPDVETMAIRPELEVGTHALDIWLASTPGASLTLEVRFRPEVEYDQIVAFFEQALSDPQENVTREALVATGLVPIIPTWEILRDVIQYKRGNYSSLTRVIAVEAFVKAGDALYPNQPGPVDGLAEVLFNDPAATPRMAAAIGLAELGNPLGVDVLQAALASETNAMVQEVIQRALTQLQAQTEAP